METNKNAGNTKIKGQERNTKFKITQEIILLPAGPKMPMVSSLKHTFLPGAMCLKDWRRSHAVCAGKAPFPAVGLSFLPALLLLMP